MTSLVDRVTGKSLIEFITECVVVTLMIEGGPAAFRGMNKVVQNVLGNNGEPKTDVVKKEEESKVVNKNGKTATTKQSTTAARKGSGTNTTARNRATTRNGHTSTAKAPVRKRTTVAKTTGSKAS